MTSALYDPLTRGPYPVGVRTLSIPDKSSGATLAVEAWYPANDRHAGEDFDPRTKDRFPVEPFPLVRSRQDAVRHAEPAALTGAPVIIFSHGLGGFRLQSTFLTTHLASHGYVVLSPDHPSSSLSAVIRGARHASRAIKRRKLSMMGRERLRNVDAILLEFPTADRELAAMVDMATVGITGHSFGGWTAIAYTSQASAIGAAVALAPIGVGYSPAFEGDDAYADCDLAYSNRPPTLILAAEFDTICPLKGIRRLHESFETGHKMLVLHDAEHFHFCDEAEIAQRLIRGGHTVARAIGRRAARVKPQDELLDANSAKLAAQGITLAHFDACLRANASARRWASGDQLAQLLDAVSVRCTDALATS